MPAMRVSYKSPDTRTLIVFEATDEKTLVKQLGQIQLIMQNDTCQACLDDEALDPADFGVVLDMRVSQGYTYYSVICQNPKCGARLEFGERKPESGGGFFVKRTKKEGDNYLDIEHRGWTWYRRSETSAPPAQAPQPAAPAPSAPPVDEGEIPF